MAFLKSECVAACVSQARVRDQGEKNGPDNNSVSCATAFADFRHEAWQRSKDAWNLPRTIFNFKLHARHRTANLVIYQVWQKKWMTSSLGSLHPLIYHGCSYIFYSVSFSMSKRRPYSSTVRIHPQTPMHNYHELYLESSGAVCPP